MSYTPEAACREINACIQNSKLHFVTQETPYSVNITIRKKFFAQAIPINENKGNVMTETDNIDEEKNQLLSEAKNENSKLEEINVFLKSEVDKFKVETEQLNKMLKSKDNEINTLKNVTAKLNNEVNENRIKAGENKKIMDDLKRSAKLEEKELYEMRKKNDKHEEKIAELEDYKRHKVLEEKCKKKAEKKLLKKETKLQLNKKENESVAKEFEDEVATTSTKNTISKESIQMTFPAFSINSTLIDTSSNNDENIQYNFKPIYDNKQDYKNDVDTNSEQLDRKEIKTLESTIMEDFRMRLAADLESVLKEGAT